ncbi:hypothetical protein J437_LFUL003563 [Ladona fulva]|uniref:FAS1 domain-containing protein n=1 Tax=Ladona fulva TaxID=123851 RepID=A0A8K0JWK0_LADFU|nr:hypothetical protein J437_LFUL003563 [Ladona fulva]
MLPRMLPRLPTSSILISFLVLNLLAEGSDGVMRRIPAGAGGVRRRVSTTVAPGAVAPVSPRPAPAAVGASGHPLRRRVPILPPAERWDKIARSQGPHVCPREEITENPDIHYFRAWTGGEVCGKRTAVKLDCCFGYGKVPGEPGCPLAKPLESLMETAKLAGAKKFVELHETSGLSNVLASTNHDAFTILAPTDHAMKQAFPEIIDEIMEDGQRNLSSYREGPPSLLYHMIASRVDLKALPQNSLIPTLFADQPIRFNVFPNGLVTADCIPIMQGSLEALGGVIHTLQSPLHPLRVKGDQLGGYSQPSSRLASLIDTVARDPQLRRFSAVLAHAQRSSASPLIQHSHLHIRQATLPAAVRPMTLFVPTNEAFSGLPTEFMQSVLYDQEGLSALISNHLIDGIVCSSIIGAGGTQRVTRASNNVPGGIVGLNARGARKPPHMLKTLTGAFFRGACDYRVSESTEKDASLNSTTNGNLTSTNSSNVEGGSRDFSTEDDEGKNPPFFYKIGDAVILKSDIMALDGVIHVIDRLLIPRRAQPLLQIATELGLNTLLSLLPNTGLQTALGGRGSLTLFAPSDKAFRALPNSTLNHFYKNPQDARILLLSHMTSGRHLSSNFVDMQLLHSRYPGRDLKLKVFRGNKIIEGGRLIDADNEGSNGVLHVIDQVLIPPEESLADYLQFQGNFSRFLTALSKTSPSLLDLIKTAKDEKIEMENGFDEALFTVFAVSDEVIDIWASDLFTFEGLVADEEMLNSVMRNHIVPGVLWTKTIEAGGFYPVQGIGSGLENNGTNKVIMMKRSTSGDSLNVGNAQLIGEEGENGSQKSNIYCTNGVLHQVNHFIQIPNPYIN